MATGGCSHTVFFRIGVLLLGWVGLMGSGALYAEEKTPPFHSKEDAKDSVPAAGPTVPAPAKDFSTLFSRPAPAPADTKTPPIDEGGFQTQEYVVKEGDWLVKILREKGLADDHNLPELLSLLRKLNSSLHDLDMIKPGEKILILVKVVPDERLTEKTLPPKLSYDTYRVEQGDILSQVAMERYPLSKETFNREYLRLFAAYNPSVKDPNHLVPGQVIKLPRYPQPEGETHQEPPVLLDLEKTPNRVALRPKTPIEPSPPTEPSPAPKPKRPPTAPKSAAHEPAIKPTPWETTQAPKPWPADLKPVMPEAPPVPTPQVIPEAPQLVASESTLAEKEPATPASPWPADLKPVMPEPSKDRVSSTVSGGSSTFVVADGLGTVISRMGEEWIHSGEHVIPMKSGGHIQLDAQSYPMVRFRDGITLIVDLNNTLPPKMGHVIESTWANYRVIRLSPNDDLHSALDKMLNILNYQNAVEKGKPLTLGGVIPLAISGDWIVTPPQTARRKEPRYVVINLLDRGSRGLPAALKTYLKGMGVEVIEYPSTEPDVKGSTAPGAAETARDPAELIRAVLSLRGIPFKTQVNLPAYKTSNEDFRFTVLADFYLEIQGRRYVIDVGGLNPDVASLLKENGISVLSLGRETEPVAMASGILEFLGIPFNRGPLAIAANPGNMSSQVTVTLSGVTFVDRKGTSVLATPINLPAELIAFLSEKGYAVLVMSPFALSRSGGAQDGLPVATQKRLTQSHKDPKEGTPLGSS